ncbi:2-succinyl-5-enolpyruvyl-6-hydroxy-3-cyclohexene-1-carboxylic-acid synthase, partial [Vibrio makurazakiensis]|uniref:2-succinyl-5-enolpyruvyl-6-hydroxy-3- cyclohexene-1-carboxylic-acid synthase n=1 Tax=Vibrio makurazakiensis TaxID=2910250 RepID=UPI003D0B535E
MSDDRAILNRIWSETLLEELSRLGVVDVCMAPGSRSTPLTLEAAANTALTLHSHFDERGLGFYALGLAKASGRPVAIIVTSGTAVANLLPAVAEAGLTGERLILLTADRPVELIGCGANQAINQIGVFSSHVTDTLNLPSPSVDVALNWLLSSVDQLVFKQSREGGPLHINCPFPEPLYSNNSKEHYSDYLNSIDKWKGSLKPYTLHPIAEPLHCGEPLAANYLNCRGVVILGSLALEEAQQAIEWANTLGWPVFCDSQSGVSSDWAHYDLWMPSVKAQEMLSHCDFVIQFGERIVSKRLNQWVSQHCADFLPSQHVVVSPGCHRINQFHLPLTQLTTSVKPFVSSQPKPSLISNTFGWANDLIEVSKTSNSLAHAQILNNEYLTELAIAVDLSARVKQRDLFIGNSLIVRLIDMFSNLSGNQVFSNRGASGIDGLVATMAGVVQVTEKPTLMLIGDTSLLYDLNSLALMSNVETPVVIVVTNNDGGAIFDLLPVPQPQKQSLYQLPHGYDFKNAAQQFNLQYSQPET